MTGTRQPNARGIAAMALCAGKIHIPDCDQRAFVQDLAYTAAKRKRALDAVIKALVARKPGKTAMALLEIGAAQLLYMDGVPDFAAVGETVEAAKTLCGSKTASFVNGVLRNIARNREALVAKHVSAASLAVRESHPDAIIEKWTARFGETAAETLAKLDNEPAQTFRARPDGTFTPLERGRRVDETDGYAEGKFIVQDPATAASIALLDPREGESVLDACAAPGGKTIQCAWRGAGVAACEPDGKRRERLAENIARTRLEGKVRIFAAPPEGESFDKALVDAPCSNSGVFRRRPDARWNWSMEKVAELCAVQAQILDDAASRVRPGGTLVYSTCSIEPEENAHQCAAFLERHGDWTFLRSREILPHIDGCDGAFAALFAKKDAKDGQ